MWSLILGTALAIEPHTHTFPAGTNTFDLAAEGADVRIRTGGTQIKVVGMPRQQDSMCGITYGEADPTVRYAPKGTAGDRVCEIDFDITLPSGVSVHIELDTGNVDIQHDGGLNAEITTGTVQGTVGRTSRLTLIKGEVQLLGMSSPIEVTISEGAADLGWSKAPEGTILVNLAKGDLRIDLPDDAPVDARVPANVKVPQPQKTTAPTKLMVGKASGVIILQ